MTSNLGYIQLFSQSSSYQFLKTQIFIFVVSLMVDKTMFVRVPVTPGQD
jgi:hypothetical protein